jgi:hypothetical protein
MEELPTQLADRLGGLDNPDWTSYTKLARDSGVLNFTNGAPSYPPPDFVKQAL